MTCQSLKPNNLSDNKFSFFRLGLSFINLSNGRIFIYHTKLLNTYEINTCTGLKKALLLLLPLVRK